MSSTLRQNTFSDEAYVPDAGKQLFEVVATARLLEPVVVDGKALDDVIHATDLLPRCRITCHDEILHGNQRK